MKTILIVVLIILAIGNAIGAYILYKALKLREENAFLHKYQNDLLNKFKNLQADYPAISFYAEDNQRLLSETSVEQRKEMTFFFGASITKSWDIDTYFSNIKIINRGIGAQSDMQLLTRFSSDVLQLDPGRVVIKFCSGNFNPKASPDIMWDEYEMMVRMAQAREIEPILATVIPLTRHAEEYEGYCIMEEIKEFNARIKKLAADQKLVLADYFRAMADSGGYLPDTLAMDAIHPNEKGYHVMTGVIRPILE